MSLSDCYPALRHNVVVSPSRVEEATKVTSRAIHAFPLMLPEMSIRQRGMQTPSEGTKGPEVAVAP